MRSKLLFKYAACYLVTMLATVIVLNTIGVRRIENGMTDDRLATLQEEAEVITDTYLRDYYAGTMSPTSVYGELLTIDTLAKARIWIVNPEGTVIFDTRGTSGRSGSEEQAGDRLQLTEEFLSRETSRRVEIDNVLDEPMAAVIYPVIVRLSLKGYVVLLSPLSEIRRSCQYFIDTLNVCFFMIATILLAVMIILYRVSIVPLRQTIIAAREYADGNFEYKQKDTIHRHDEFRELSDTIEFMASELKQQEDYQRKFIANISHDFRSPLTSIKGYCMAMIDGTIPPELHGKYLNTISFETDRLTKLTAGLLELNSFDRHQLLLEVTDFDINQTIKRTAETFEMTCRKKLISLHLTLTGETELVHADQGKIEQVLYNLIDNAIKFSPNDTTIDVSTSEKNQKVFVSVKDHGCGIPASAQSKVFDRFYKGDQSRGKDKKGSGLGLAIVREILRAHGEDINLISTEGVGTEFIFTLPKTEVDDIE